MQDSKACPACSQTKPSSEFFKNSRTKTGLSCYCKPCHQFKLYGPPKGRYRVDPAIKKERKKRYKEQWLKNNPEKIKNYQSKYYWTHREQELELNKKYRQENSEKERIRKHRYKKKNPDYERNNNNRRRARILATATEKYTLQEVLDKYGTNCHICNKPIDFLASRVAGKGDWQKGLHLDHVVSLSNGGTDTLDNVKPAHVLCNIRKH